MTEEVLVVEKKKANPAPNAYKTQEFIGTGRQYPSKGDKEDKYCGFIDDAKVQGAVAPGSKYNKSYSVLDKKAKTAVMWKESEKEKVTTNRFVKI